VCFEHGRCVVRDASLDDWSARRTSHVFGLFVAYVIGEGEAEVRSVSVVLSGCCCRRDRGRESAWVLPNRFVCARTGGQETRIEPRFGNEIGLDRCVCHEPPGEVGGVGDATRNSISSGDRVRGFFNSDPDGPDLCRMCFNQNCFGPGLPNHGGLESTII